MSRAARRLRALVFTAVFLIGGSGLSALDAVLYHWGSYVEATASHRIAGTDAPRPHGDTCALLDWTARGPYSVALDSQPTLASLAETDREPPVPVDSPRPTDLSAAPQPRAPPLQLT
jgi:hypothetical protein